MNVTEILKAEHRVIEQVLNCLEAMTDLYAARGTLDLSAAEQAIDFFRHFADQCHHGKEEEHLFAMMEERGFPRHRGPTGVLRYEHDQGRYLVQEMADAIAAARRGVPDALPRFVRQARAYIVFLREHIDKEDRCLFPMAEEVLTDRDKGALEVAFSIAETHLGPGTHDKYLKIANDLADDYGVKRADQDAPAAPGCIHCCGHMATH